MKKLDPNQMIGICPKCGYSWKGKSHFDSFRESCDSIVSDSEITEFIKGYYATTHQSFLIEMPNIENTKSILICPSCLSTFQRKK